MEKADMGSSTRATQNRPSDAQGSDPMEEWLTGSVQSTISPKSDAKRTQQQTHETMEEARKENEVLKPVQDAISAIAHTQNQRGSEPQKNDSKETVDAGSLTTAKQSLPSDNHDSNAMEEWLTGSVQGAIAPEPDAERTQQHKKREAEENEGALHITP